MPARLRSANMIETLQVGQLADCPAAIGSFHPHSATSSLTDRVTTLWA